MTSLLTAVAALALAQAPASSPAAASEVARAMRIAVYELSVDGADPSVDARVARVVTDAVVQELRKLVRVSVIGMDEVKAMLDVEAQKQMLGCADDSCLAEIADSLGVDGVVIGSIATVGAERVLGLKRIDQREAKTVAQVTRRLVPDDGRELLAAVGGVVEELFPELPLRPGMTRGVDDATALKLHPPPLRPWVFVSGSVVTGLGLATTAGLAIANLTVHQSVVQTMERAKDEPVSAAELRAARETTDQLAIATWAAGGVTVIAGALTALALPFTRWDDDE